ncbi:MAG: hypothetical protein MJD61_04115, partial [Proteobacteria bacterium]|nr:hypothetical protein [Pseudomonadota bacterium]
IIELSLGAPPLPRRGSLRTTGDQTPGLYATPQGDVIPHPGNLRHHIARESMDSSPDVRIGYSLDVECGQGAVEHRGLQP